VLNSIYEERMKELIPLFFERNVDQFLIFKNSDVNIIIILFFSEMF